MDYDNRDKTEKRQICYLLRKNHEDLIVNCMRNKGEEKFLFKFGIKGNKEVRMAKGET